jgi:hypothetical protein
MQNAARRSVLLCLACAAACGGSDLASSGEDTADLEYGTYVHKLPWRDSAAPPAAAPAGAHLTYWGGRVISKAKVVQVLYGAGTYSGNVSGTASPTLAQFYGGVTSSAYVDWLTEYNTTVSGGTGQTISRGSFLNRVSITPASSRNGATISDASIQKEISAQVAAGHLPAPDANTIYMVNFPKGKTISQGGSRSCVAGGFCAYHGTFKRNAQEVYYGVLPDMSAGSGCDRGCGNGTPFANQTSVASHELIETITDAEVGLATVLGKPLAWYDPNNGEIGDICNGLQGTVSGGDGKTYTVQKEWSNQAKACIVHR